MDLKKIQAPVSELPDINSMTKSELLDYIIESIDKDIVNKDIPTFARYSIERDFYEGMLRGYRICQQIIHELKGRMDQYESERSS